MLCLYAAGTPEAVSPCLKLCSLMLLSRRAVCSVVSLWLRCVLIVSAVLYAALCAGGAKMTDEPDDDVVLCCIECDKAISVSQAALDEGLELSCTRCHSEFFVVQE